MAMARPIFAQLELVRALGRSLCSQFHSSAPQSGWGSAGAKAAMPGEVPGGPSQFATSLGSSPNWPKKYTWAHAVFQVSFASCYFPITVSITQNASLKSMSIFRKKIPFKKGYFGDPGNLLDVKNKVQTTRAGGCFNGKRGAPQAFCRSAAVIWLQRCYFIVWRHCMRRKTELLCNKGFGIGAILHCMICMDFGFGQSFVRLWVWPSKPNSIKQAASKMALPKKLW